VPPRPLALFAMAATAAVGFLHYIGIGPNENRRRRRRSGTPRIGEAAMSTPKYQGNSSATHTAGTRINHWIVAISFVLLALSGLALFQSPRSFG